MSPVVGLSIGRSARAGVALGVLLVLIPVACASPERGPGPTAAAAAAKGSPGGAPATGDGRGNPEAAGATLSSLAAAASGPSLAALAVDGEIRATAPSGTWQASDLRLLVARSGAARLRAGEVLLVADGARLECRGPGDEGDAGPAWRPPSDAGPCSWLSPWALVRALLPRDPTQGRDGRRLALVWEEEGPVLLEIEAAADRAARVSRRFFFDAGERIRAREWLEPAGAVELRVEYTAQRGGRGRQVTMVHPDPGIRVELRILEVRPDPQMTREDFRLPPAAEAAPDDEARTARDRHREAGPGGG